MPAYRSSVQDQLALILRRNRPIDHPFFPAMCALPSRKLTDPVFIGKTYDLCSLVLHALRLASMKLPHMHTLQWHRRHLAVLNDYEENFIRLTVAFSAMGAADTRNTAMLNSMPVMRKHLPYPLFQALAGLEELYSGSLGAWVLSDTLMLDWLAAIGAALAQHADLSIVATSYFADSLGLVLSLAQDVISALPHLDGPTLRGMQEAMPHWQAIWNVQHEMILEETKR